MSVDDMDTGMSVEVTITLGIITNLATDVLKHHSQRLEGTRLGKALKAAGLVDKNFHERIEELLVKTWEVFFETNPRYSLSTVHAFLHDDETTKTLSEYVLEGKEIELNNTLKARFDHHLNARTPLDNAYLRMLEREGISIRPENIFASFVASYESALYEHLDLQGVAIVHQVMKQGDEIIGEVWNAQRLLEAQINQLERSVRSAFEQSLASDAADTNSIETELIALTDNTPSAEGRPAILTTRDENMANLPSLLSELRALMLKCAAFSTDQSLRAVVTLSELRDWRPQFPQATSPDERVNLTIAFLLDQKHISGQNSLLLFIDALVETVNPTNALHSELRSVRHQLTSFLDYQ